MFAQRNGRGYFAEVTVSVEEQENKESEVSLSGSEFEHLKQIYGPNAITTGPDYDAHRTAAVEGVQYALRHGGKSLNVHVVIEKIVETLTDSTPECVAFAACFAVWKALGVEGTAHPTIGGKGIEFPAGLKT
jgi:hypothetical protein